MLYIHIPYCHQKCTYCAFYSSPTRRSRSRYIDALCQEISLRAPLYADGSRHSLRTLYLGGGTPSLLDISEMERIVDCVRSHFDASLLEEATLEANPENLTRDYLENLANFHLFNRLSIGIQSFHDDELRMLNRCCDARQALLAIESAAAAGFSNISIDLIYGLPGQSLSSWEDNLNQLSHLAPLVSHLSAYALSIEPHTMLAAQIAAGQLSPADEETVLSQYEALLDWCHLHGFQQYEISSFARPGRKSVHNSRYWDRSHYIGVGAAAHSFDGTRRRWNVADIDQYCSAIEQGEPFHEEELLSPADAHNEYLMTALRTTAGIDKSLIDPHCRESLRQGVAPFLQSGWLVETPTHYLPTHDGLLHADGIAADLFQ